MDEYRFRSLLELADAPPPCPSLARSLAEGARAAHRRGRRRTAAIVLTAALLSVGLWRNLAGPKPAVDEAQGPLATAAPAADPVAEYLETQRQLAEVRAQIERDTAAVNRLLGVERRRKLDALQNGPASSADDWSLDEKAGRAALALLVSAERNAESPAFQAAAESDYDKVIQLFPESRWAGEAQQRLAAMRP